MSTIVPTISGPKRPQDKVLLSDASLNKTLSCGLLGPEIVGTIVDISKETVSVN